jgi:hypothetical protein
VECSTFKSAPLDHQAIFALLCSALTAQCSGNE